MALGEGPGTCTCGGRVPLSLAPARSLLHTRHFGGVGSVRSVVLLLNILLCGVRVASGGPCVPLRRACLLRLTPSQQQRRCARGRGPGPCHVTTSSGTPSSWASGWPPIPLLQDDSAGRSVRSVSLALMTRSVRSEGGVRGIDRRERMRGISLQASAASSLAVPLALWGQVRRARAERERDSGVRGGSPCRPADDAGRATTNGLLDAQPSLHVAAHITTTPIHEQGGAQCNSETRRGRHRKYCCCCSRFKIAEKRVRGKFIGASPS